MGGESRNCAMRAHEGAALMTSETRALSTDVDYSDLDMGLTAEEFQPPRMRYNGKNGEFSWDGEDETFGSFAAVLLVKRPYSRVKFHPDDDKDEIQCRSNDNVRPVDAEQAAAIGAGGRTHDSCADCQFSKFTEKEDGSFERPACTEFLNLAMSTFPEGEDDADPTPFLFSIKGSNEKGVLSTLSKLKTRSSAARRPWFQYIVEFSAGTFRKEGRREWYPLASKVTSDTITPDLLPVMADLARFMQRAKIDATGPVAAADDGEPADFDASGNPVSARGEEAIQTPPAAQPEPQNMMERARQGVKVDGKPIDTTGRLIPDAPEKGEQPRPMTEPQLKAIYAIGHGQKLSDDDLHALCVERYGLPVEGLNRAEASGFIDLLKAKGAQAPVTAGV
jgi:hypothetical protein